MAITVTALCSYLTDTSVDWRKLDYDVRAIVRALKHERFKGG